MREKDLDGRALLALVAAVAAALAGSGTALVVNGRPDVAVRRGSARRAASRGRAVRRRREARVPVARRSAPRAIPRDEAARAQDAGRGLIVFGPVLRHAGEGDRARPGSSALAAVAAAVRVPVHAVGGIGPEHARDVAAAGARGILAIRAFLERRRVAAAAAAFRSAP